MKKNQTLSFPPFVSFQASTTFQFSLSPSLPPPLPPSLSLSPSPSRPPHLRWQRLVLPISGGRGGPAGGRDFPSSGALRRRWPMPLSRSPLPGGKSRRPQLILPISRHNSSSPSWDAGARCWRPGAALRCRRGGSSSPARAVASRRRAADLDAAWGSQPVGMGRIESTGPKRFRS